MAYRYNAGKRPKYGNKKTVLDGEEFDSQLEARRYAFLKLMEKAGEIKDLQRQVRFELIPSVKHTETVQLKTKTKEVERTDQLGIYYTADFTYTIASDGTKVVEDVKGNPDNVSADVPLRFKLFYWRYGRKVRVVTKANEEINKK